MSALHLFNARRGTAAQLEELRVEDGRFVTRFSPDCSPQVIDLAGRLVLPGLVETHIHLDKACILERCQLAEGTLAEAIAQTSRAKATFTEEDVYTRGAQVLEKAILQGTTYMRTHVEIDPQIGLTGFNAIQRLKQDYAWA
nr:amidohydrolase family protein [Pseudomonas sp.]